MNLLYSQTDLLLSRLLTSTKLLWLSSSINNTINNFLIARTFDFFRHLRLTNDDDDDFILDMEDIRTNEPTFTYN